jgi:glyoxylate/hydroxypyruvate reductase A
MVDPTLCYCHGGETALWATLSLHRRFFSLFSQQQTSKPNGSNCLMVCAHTVRVTIYWVMGEMGRAVANRLVRQGYKVHGWRLGVNNKADYDERRF